MKKRTNKLKKLALCSVLALKTYAEESQSSTTTNINNKSFLKWTNFRLSRTQRGGKPSNQQTRKSRANKTIRKM